MTLLFDTETTGLVNFKIPQHLQESRMVQLGMILVDDELNIVHEVGLIIKPEGFVIDQRMSDIHGVTQEMAFKKGVPLPLAILLFNELADKCDIYVGHNIKFDKAIIASDSHKSGYPFPDKLSFCTMLESTPLCKMKSARGGYKWPKLSEAYEYFFNEPLIDAHDALTDVRATLRIYKFLKEHSPKEPFALCQ